jgi:dihydrofolate reductase
MSKVVVFTSLTLDGVMQAPGRPDEDTRGGFQHGGWARPYNDEVMGTETGKHMATTSALLLGRLTYENLHSYWPKKEPDSPFTAALTNSQKYVASNTVSEPLEWANSTLLQGDAADAVAELREAPGGDIVIIGSGGLIQSLQRRNLIDEYVLLIHPLVLGSGLRLFPEDGTLAALELVDSVPTTTGVVIATYRPAEPAAGQTT